MKPEVNITRRYYVPQEKLWGALAEGFLFIYTGAVKESLSVDFKTGGKISISWDKGCSGPEMTGEFLEVTPQSKITFSWKTAEVASSTVFVNITSHAGYCEMNLRHEFPVGTDTKDYDFGWDDSMYDLKKHVYGKK